MRALVKTAMGPGNVEVRDVPEPSAGPGMVKVKVVKAGLCGSDVHEAISRIAIKINPPVTMGHEMIGIVEEVGEGVTRFKPGQKVTAEIGQHVCGVCDFCREGYYNVCIERRILGYWYDGIFAEKVVIPESNVVAVPDSIDFVEGALIEPLACACHMCYDMAEIKPQDVVLISGPGPIGQLTAQVARNFGATVVVTGLAKDRARLDKAKELGAHYVVDVENEDLKALIMDITNGYGVDVVLECSASNEAILTGLALAKKRGYYVQFGLGEKMVNIDMEAITYKELKFTGSMASRNYNWRRAISLLEAKKVNTEALASEPYSLYDWDKAIEVFQSKEAYKIIIDPNLDGPVH